MKRLRVSRWDGWDASPSQGYPQLFAGTHLYTWVERGTVRVKCVAQEHNTMYPARSRTRMRQPRFPQVTCIIDWILFASSNEYCLNCFINGGENRMRIKANLSNFATILSNVILLPICGNYQTHIRDIEYWHISATIVGDACPGTSTVTSGTSTENLSHCWHPPQPTPGPWYNVFTEEKGWMKKLVEGKENNECNSQKKGLLQYML